ncbi:MAG: PTS sugar transporter subunit IIA [Phycisphaeraceae bacterium]|nr:PTS sugar transporter subunit IIA [Phycisphaeraceae bacterium]
MRLSDILTRGCVKVPLAAKTKQEAIFELADLLCDQAGIDAHDQLKQAIWQREQTRTTGIGNGVAIPHGKIEGCPKLVMAVGKTAEPIEFESIDRRPVQIIFLLASPLDQTGPHIQALAAISRMLTDSDLRAAIKNAAAADDLYRIIAQHGGQPAPTA